MQWSNILLAAIFIFNLIFPCFVLNGEENSGELFQQAITEYLSGKYEAAIESFRKLHEYNPKDDIALYMLAASLSNAGQPDESLKQIRSLAETGSCLRPSDQTFRSLASLPEYQSLVGRLSARQSVRSQTVFTIPEPDFYPEGIAYDATTGSLFVGSVHKRKIIRIKIRENKIEPFVDFQNDDLMAVLGMKVDFRTQQLWAVSIADPTMQGYSEKDHAGMNAVYQYDIKGRSLIRKFLLSGKPAHNLNDLVLDSSGRVYVTDSATGEIFTIPPKGKTLEVWIPSGNFVSPNGIAISEDGKTLYVADTMKGIYAVTVSDRSIHRVRVASGIETPGIDGLYWYNNSLIGVFNMTRPGRIIRFYLDKSRQVITDSTVLECGNPVFEDPTTAAMAGDSLYIIANSQLSKFHEDGTPFDLEELNPIRILMLKIENPN